MKLRQALIEQSPSLALQRAAQNEIALMDNLLQAAIFVWEFRNLPHYHELSMTTLEDALVAFSTRTAG